MGLETGDWSARAGVATSATPVRLSPARPRPATRVVSRRIMRESPRLSGEQAGQALPCEPENPACVPLRRFGRAILSGTEEINAHDALKTTCWGLWAKFVGCRALAEVKANRLQAAPGGAAVTVRVDRPRHGVVHRGVAQQLEHAVADPVPIGADQPDRAGVDGL